MRKASHVVRVAVRPASVKLLLLCTVMGEDWMQKALAEPVEVRPASVKLLLWLIVNPTAM